MANPVYEVLLTKERLDTPSAIVDLAVGAAVDFSGIVRELEDGREIEGIEYEAHATMAQYQLEKIVQQALSDFRLRGVVIHHRVGFVPAGEPSLFVRVTAQHRGEAFTASQWIVDELKRKAPIWKRPRFKIGNEPGKKAGVADKMASIPSRA
jgi:molybdopterin synthase catalytic subunit